MSMRTFNLPCDILRQLYLEEGLRVADIAARIGCSPSTISNRLHACGITTRSGRFQARMISSALLEQLYSVERLPLPMIAIRLGVSVGTVHNRRRAYGIPIRPRGESGHLQQQTHTRGKQRLREESLNGIFGYDTGLTGSRKGSLGKTLCTFQPGELHRSLSNAAI